MSANALAKECGIDQGQLSRLLNRKLKRVSTLTYKRLLSTGLPDEMSEMQRLLLSGKTQAVISAHQVWLRDRENSQESEAGLSPEERKLVSELASDYPKVRRALQKLARVVRTHRHDYGRWLAALRDVLEPLNRYFTTLGVERGFHEFSKDELASFVTHGLERERILLNRGPDLVRAQQAAENVGQISYTLGERIMRFGFGRPYCWEFRAIADTSAGTVADPYVLYPEVPLKRPRPRGRK